MGELLPVACGLFLGATLGSFGLNKLNRILWIFVLLLALTVSAVTGELKDSWAFLVLDLALVSLACALGKTLASYALRRRVTLTARSTTRECQND